MTTKPCLDCGMPTNYGSRCAAHQRLFLAQRTRRRGSATARGYGSEWQRVGSVAIAEHPACVRCGSTSDLTGDHIIPLRLGGTSTAENIQVLCRSCNSAKGAA